MINGATTLKQAGRAIGKVKAGYKVKYKFKGQAGGEAMYPLPPRRRCACLPPKKYRNFNQLRRESCEVLPALHPAHNQKILRRESCEVLPPCTPPKIPQPTTPEKAAKSCLPACLAPCTPPKILRRESCEVLPACLPCALHTTKKYYAEKAAKSCLPALRPAHPQKNTATN